MKQRLVFSISLIALLIVVFIAGMYLVQKTYVVRRSQEDSQAPEALPYGELFISDVHYGSASPPYDSKILDGMRVEEFEIKKEKVGDDEFNKLEITVSFNYQGSERKLVIPILNEVSYEKRSGQSEEDGSDKSELIPVLSLPLKTNEYLGAIVAYVPHESDSNADSLRDYFSSFEYDLGLMYIDAGFGSFPIDFNQYLTRVLQEDENPKFDYRKIFIQKIII